MDAARLIEQAAKRLEELRRAGVEVSQVPESAQPPDYPPSIPPVSSVQPAAARLASASRPPSRKVALDLDQLAAHGFVTPSAPRSRIADEFRILKRPLIANATPKKAGGIRNGNLVMVTSAVPSEGKTFTAVNLALSIAMELDRTVLLVDGDVARPSLPRTFRIEPTTGLMDLIGADRLQLHHVMLRTNVPQLDILLSGSQYPRAAEMLASDAMGRFLEELATADPNRIVIFDSPPLLPTTEARLLAARMGQVIFVVHAETTRQSDVKQALATIEACPVKLLVLNGATTSSQGAYGYGYGYGYGNVK